MTNILQHYCPPIWVWYNVFGFRSGRGDFIHPALPAAMAECPEYLAAGSGAGSVIGSAGDRSAHSVLLSAVSNLQPHIPTERSPTCIKICCISILRIAPFPSYPAEFHMHKNVVKHMNCLLFQSVSSFLFHEHYLFPYLWLLFAMCYIYTFQKK